MNKLFLKKIKKNIEDTLLLTVLMFTAIISLFVFVIIMQNAAEAFRAFMGIK